MPIDSSQLASFCGDLERTRHWLKVLLMTPGVLYVGENGGGQGAMWLIDAIASYQADRRITANEKLRAMQFWTLRVQAGNKAVLFCTDGDSDEHVIEQAINYTDFDLPEIQLYVCDNGDGTRTVMLPSEY